MPAKVNEVFSRPKTVCDSLCHVRQMGKTSLRSGFYSQLKDFCSKIFNTADWPARWHCGNWTDFHGWLYIFSDLAIWAAYFAIPVLLFRLLYKRKDVPFSGIFWLFIAFIMLCGTTHLLDAIIFWWPAYRLSALVRLATAIVSIFTVYALYKTLPVVYKLRTLEQLEAEIEERKKAEQEARNQQILKQAAEELMAKKDEFMSIASHELKTPITSLKASLQLMERMVERDENMKDLAPFMGKAVKQVNKLTGIIYDLLDVTRIQAGKLELVKNDFNLMDMVKDCVEHCRLPAHSHEIQIIGDDHLMINADPNRLEQVLSNFFTNAFKYSDDNELVTIIFEELDNGRIKVAVSDKGIGIAQDKLKSIFERFYQVDDLSRRTGVGLGLYISSEIIKRHNGEIGVESMPGQGSTFWFVI